MKPFYKCKYGMFIHHILREARYADGSQAQTIDEMADAFDTEGFADSLARMGVEYIIYTAWHFAVQPLYPSAVSEKWRPGNCPKRDLLGDIIDSVRARGIHVLFYTHPRDGHDFSEDDKEKTGWGRGRHESDEQQPCYDTFRYDQWNEYMLELYTELADRYAARLTGFYTDGNGPKDPADYLYPPKDHQIVNYLKIRNIMKSRNPKLVTFQNYYGNVYTQDYGNSETYTVYIGSAFGNGHSEKWHCAKKNATTLSPFCGWACASSRNTEKMVNWAFKDMLRFTMFNGSCSECGNVLFASATFIEGNLWSVGVEETMIDLKNELSRFKDSFMDAVPSTSYPTFPGSTLERNNYCFWMSDEKSEYEYLHCMQMPADGVLEFGLPEDGIVLEDPVLLTGEGSVTLEKTDSGYRVHFTGTPDETDTVIRFCRTGRSICCGYEWINNTDKRIAYHGNWNYTSCWIYTKEKTADGCYEREVHCANGADSSLYLAFDGDMVELYGVLGEKHGKADVYVDGVFCGTIDQQAEEHRAHVLCFRSINLYGGRHVLQLYTKDDKTFAVDAVKVISSPVLE